MVGGFNPIGNRPNFAHSDSAGAGAGDMCTLKIKAVSYYARDCVFCTTGAQVKLNIVADCKLL